MPCEAAPDLLGDSADPRRYLEIDTHEHALDVLLSSVREARTPALLLGASGVGKTLVLRVLADRARRCGHRAVFSPFLHLPPDEVARWLLHLLAKPAPFDGDLETALLGEAARDDAPLVVIVDEIQSASGSSVQHLVELARAAAGKVAVVVAGTPGPSLDALRPALGVETTVALPDALPRGEIARLCDAILADPTLELALRGVAPSEREALVQAACGVPALLKNAIVRRAVGVEPAPYCTPETVRIEADAPVSQPAQPRIVAPPVRAEAPSEDVIDLAEWVARRPPPARPRLLRLRLAAARTRVASSRDAAMRRGSAMRVALARVGGRSSHALRRCAAATTEIAVTPVRRVRTAVGTTAARAAYSTRQSVELYSQSLRAHAATGTARLARVPSAIAALAARASRFGSELRGRMVAAIDRNIAVFRSAAAAARARGARLAGVLTRPRTALVAASLMSVLVMPVPHGRSRESSVPTRPARVAPPSDVAQAAAEIPSVASADSAPPSIQATAAPPIRVHVNSRPWARIRVDGVDEGTTPLSHLQLTPGHHDFEARLADGRVVARRIDIGPETRLVSFP